MQNDNASSHTHAGADKAPPTPGGAFRWERETWGHALRCVPLASVAQHLFTSAQPPLPLGDGGRVGAAARDRDEAWRLVAASVGARRDQVRRVRQVHGNAVRVIARGVDAGAGAMEKPDGDAVVSNVPGLMLAVLVADCVPILLAEAASGAAAAIHAGWRGTCAGIVNAAVERMASGFGTRPEDMVCAIGPSIGPDDYEVGDSLLADFTAAGYDPGALARWFRRGEGDGRLFLDLWQANQDQLIAAGVRPERIHLCGLSTFRHPGWLESYRRDGPGAGRMVAAVSVP